MISIVIPVYNEQNAIVETIERCQKVVKQISPDGEVIVVNDGSTDNTAERLKGLDVIICNHPHNIGYGKSLKDGILKAKNEFVAISDADGTYPVEMIPDMLTKVRDQDFNLVVGCRLGKNLNTSLGKKILRSFLKFLVEFTAGRKIPDINSGLRVFRRSEMLPYLPHLCDTFSFTTSMTLAYMMTSKFVTYVDIQYEKRTGETKVKLFRDSLRTLQYITEAIIYYNPMKLFILASGFLLLLALLCFIVTFFLQLNSTFMLGIGFILCSVMMLGFGLIAIQIKKISTKV